MPHPAGYNELTMANPMLDQGPVPRFVHGTVEYVAGVAFIIAPLLLDFESNAAVAVSIVVGIVVLVVAAITEGAPGMIELLPIELHVVLDLVLSVFLIAAPFLLAFSDETNPTAFFIALGVIHLLLTVGTRFRRLGEGT